MRRCVFAILVSVTLWGNAIVAYAGWLYLPLTATTEPSCGFYCYYYKGKPHGGIDYSIVVGTPIVSPCNGVVTKIVDGQPNTYPDFYSYGNYVRIENDNGDLYSIVKNLNNSEEQWIELKNDKQINKWSYADMMIYTPYAESVAYRAKTIIDGKERWLVVVNGKPLSSWDYVDNLKLDYFNRILIYRARDDMGQWHYQVIDGESLLERSAPINPMVDYKL